MPAKTPRSTPRPSFVLLQLRDSHPDVASGLARRSAKRELTRQTGNHLGNPGLSL